jgi:hypothetical protein
MLPLMHESVWNDDRCAPAGSENGEHNGACNTRFTGADFVS